MTGAVTQTGAVTLRQFSALLETGLQQGSTARMNTAANTWNPRYGTLDVKLRLDAEENVFMFAGFKKSLDAPTETMTESHAGLLFYGGTLYFSTGNSDPLNPTQQKTTIAETDMTRWLLFRINFNRFKWYSLPYTVPYFDTQALPGLQQGMTRKWSAETVNGSTLPEDTVHYLVFYIANTVGANRTLELQHLNYGEVYPD
jgi:hypothetical protein